MAVSSWCELFAPLSSLRLSFLLSPLFLYIVSRYKHFTLSYA